MNRQKKIKLLKEIAAGMVTVDSLQQETFAVWFLKNGQYSGGPQGERKYQGLSKSEYEAICDGYPSNCTVILVEYVKKVVAPLRDEGSLTD